MKPEPILILTQSEIVWLLIEAATDALEEVDSDDLPEEVRERVMERGILRSERFELKR